MLLNFYDVPTVEVTHFDEEHLRKLLWAISSYQRGMYTIHNSTELDHINSIGSVSIYGCDLDVKDSI